MRRLSLGLLLCASIGFGLAFAQAAKPPKEKKTPEQSARGSEPKVADLLDDPIKAISYAAKANAVAHKPIFWQQFSGYDSLSTDDPTTQERKTEKKDYVKGWVDDVEQMTETLKDVFKTSASQTEKWDEATRQQLRRYILLMLQSSHALVSYDETPAMA
jgi:hypothetical protein